MPYLVSSIIAVVTALIILMTRYEADDSAITTEIERAKSMFITVDEFVNTYIQSGGDMFMGETVETDTYKKINFATLYKNGILLGSISKDDIKNVSLNDNILAENESDKNIFFQSQLQFPSSQIVWQIVPIVSYTVTDYKGKVIYLSKSVGAGYQLFIDFSKNTTLMSKDAFSENFFGKEICEKELFGSFINNATLISSTDLTLTLGETNIDGKLACIIFK